MKKLLHKDGHCCGGHDHDCCTNHDHHEHSHTHCYTHDHEHTAPGHSHEHEHCREHTHEHVHQHGHDHDADCAHNHTHESTLGAEQTLVLLGYTLDHNRAHLGELGDIEAGLRKMDKCGAADAIHNSIHHFEKAIAEMEKALKAAKE